MTDDKPALPTATLAIDMQLTNPPRPRAVTVLIDGKPAAVLALDHFFAVAKRVHRAQVSASRLDKRERFR